MTLRPQDLWKKRVIDGIVETTLPSSPTGADIKRLVLNVVHDLVAWTPDGNDHINNDPTLEYLRDDRP